MALNHFALKMTEINPLIFILNLNMAIEKHATGYSDTQVRE